MPIVSVKDTKPTGQVITTPRIHSPDVKLNVVDTKFQPLSSLMTFVEGSVWTIDYYSQVINKDNALAGQDTDQSPVYQQYKLLKGLELKVASALSWSQDEESKSMLANGSAHIHSLVIPNNGDMFIGDVGDGRAGVFQIYNTEKKSLFTESVYLIDYQLIYFVNQDKDRKVDLDSKVVQTLYYKKDFLLNGQNPLLVKSDFDAVEELSLKYKELINHYFRWFFSDEFNTLILPGQEHSIYDHYLVEFISSILKTNENEKLRYLRILNCDDDYYLKEPSLWFALLNKDKTALDTGIQKTGLVSTNLFSSKATFEGIRFSGIDFVVYPKDHQPVYDSLILNNRFNKVLSEIQIQKVPTRKGDLSTLIYDQHLDFNNTSIKAINSVLADEYYVLSENFYSNLHNQTLLEVMIRNFFEKEKNNPVTLLSLINNYANWGGLERFYYIPLLLVLIKDVVGSV